MQNYIDVKTEKQKAFSNMLKKYAPAFFSAGAGVFLSFFEIVDIIHFIPGIESKIDSNINLFFILGCFVVIVSALWGVFYFFSRDFVLFTALMKDQFQIQTDYIEAIRPNNAQIKNNSVLKRYKIYFRNTTKTFDDSYFTNLQPGDFVYVWFNTEPKPKIIHVTKIN